MARTLVMRASPYPTAEEIVASRARREPMRPALEWHRRGLLLGRLADLSAATAAGLAKSAAPGGAVAQLMSNTPGVVVTTLGIWRAGCAAVPLDVALDPEEIGRRLVHSGVDAVVVHEEHLERAQRALRGAGWAARLLISRGPELIPAGRPGRPRTVPLRGRRGAGAARERGARDVAFHAYVDGAAGPPRAALLSHANVVASALRVSGGRGDGPDDVALATHPLCDVTAFVAEVLSRLISGGAAAILARPDADGLLAMIEDYRITDVSLSSELVAQVLDRRQIARRGVRSVRKILLRNVRLPMTAKRELVGRFPEGEIIQSYGKTESTGGILMARQDALFRKPDTLGKPHPGLVVGVADESGRLLRPGQRGEIVCRGAVVMRGYHRSAKLTGAVLRDGWLHTGDLGYIDEDGEFELAGRVPARAPEERRAGKRA